MAVPRWLGANGDGKELPSDSPPRACSLVAIRRLCRFGGEPFALVYRLLNGAHHVERRLRQMVVLAFAKPFEAANSIGKLDEHAGRAGEYLGDMERLREEALDLARPRDRK